MNASFIHITQHVSYIQHTSMPQTRLPSNLRPTNVCILTTSGHVTKMTVTIYDLL